MISKVPPERSFLAITRERAQRSKTCYCSTLECAASEDDFWPPTFAEINKNVSGLREKFWQFKIMIQSFLLELASPGRARQSIETDQKCTLPALLNKTINETNLCLKYFCWHQPKLTEYSRKVNLCYKGPTRRAKSRYVSHT